MRQYGLDLIHDFKEFYATARIAVIIAILLDKQLLWKYD